jgi:autotransporter-associated beta strand protein
VAGNTANIVSAGGTNGTDNTVNITGAEGFIDKGIYFNGADFAYRNALNGYARAPLYGTDATFITTATASNHVKLSASYSGAGMSLLSLNLAGSAVGWTNTSGNLAVSGIIKSGGGSQSAISGGNTGVNNTELVIRTDTSSDSLAISSNLTQGNGALTKSGAGTLTLSGTNTYSGATNVNGGTLALGASNVISGGAVTIHSATLDAATFTDTVGTLNAAASATINLGSGAALAFAASNGVSWSGTLNITGTFVSGSSLRFGTANTGLTATQLSRITINSVAGSYTLDASGFLISGGGGSSAYDTWKAANAPGSNPGDDTDGDGVSNAVEFVLGGTSATKDLDKLPVPDASGSNLTFIFERAQSSIDPKTAVFIETSTDLATWNTLPSPYTVPDGVTAGPPVTVVKGVPANFDTVTLTVTKAPDAKKFARLKVVITP